MMQPGNGSPFMCHAEPRRYSFDTEYNSSYFQPHPSQTYSSFSPYRQQAMPPPIEQAYQQEFYIENVNPIAEGIYSPVDSQKHMTSSPYSEGRKKKGGIVDFFVKYKTEVFFSLIL